MSQLIEYLFDISQIVSHLFRTRELDVSIQQKAANFNQIQESWNQSNAQFMDSVEQVYNHSREIQAILMETKVRKALEIRKTEVLVNLIKCFFKSKSGKSSSWQKYGELNSYKHTDIILFVRRKWDIRPQGFL